MRTLRITKRQALVIQFKLDMFYRLFGTISRKADESVEVE